MRTSGYCTANSYKFKELGANLKTCYKVSIYEAEALQFPYENGNICIFAYGCVTFWNLTVRQELDFLKILKPFESGAVTPDYHSFDYEIDNEYKVSQDIITLSNQMSIDMQKLAVSYGISQSMKLSVFETRIDATIERTRHIPEELASTGRIAMSRNQLSRQIGALFLERNSINLHTDILDTPGFFWDHPEYDPIYSMTVKDLDIESRTTVLNKRLDIIHELFNVLQEALNNRHATMLEWVVITLISAEIIISLVAHFYHL